MQVTRQLETKAVFINTMTCSVVCRWFSKKSFCGCPSQDQPSGRNPHSANGKHETTQHVCHLLPFQSVVQHLKSKHQDSKHSPRRVSSTQELHKKSLTGSSTVNSRFVVNSFHLQRQAIRVVFIQCCLTNLCWRQRCPFQFMAIIVMNWTPSNMLIHFKT